MTNQRLIPSHLLLPWLVYHKNGGSQVFYDVLQHRWEEKNIPWLHHFVCMDVNCGWRPKQELRLPDTNPERDFYEVADALLYNGKIYALVASYFAIIDAPDVSYLYLGSGRLPPHDVGQSSTHVGESDGQLFKVLVYPYDELFQSPPRTVVVLRLNDSSQRWEVASDLGNRVFMLGTYYSASLPAYSIIVDADIKGDLINFYSKGSIHSFDMHCRGLTTHYHGEHWAELLLEETHELVHERSFKETDQNRKQFDHPKYVSDCSWRDYYAERGGGIVALSARTPWLMLRQGYDSIIKCVGPCSNTAYELNLPDLVDHTFRYSIDGWVIASHWNSWFFFTSFTGKNIDIRLGTHCSDGVAVSSSPTNWEDCLVFSIFEEEQGEGIIELLRLSDGSVTCLNYASNLPFNLSSSSPVYHRGLFYCLGHTGNLGVYDPEANTWIVNGLFLPLDIVGLSLFREYMK